MNLVLIYLLGPMAENILVFGRTATSTEKGSLFQKMVYEEKEIGPRVSSSTGTFTTTKMKQVKPIGRI